MARINLLPWRDKLYKERLIEFLATFVSIVLITLIGMYGVHSYIEGMKDYQNRRNKILDKEIAKLNIKIREIQEMNTKKSRMLDKIDIIYELQRSRPEVVHLFEELASTLPEGVFLTSFKQSGNALSIHGKSQSNAQISAYIRAIDASEWLHNPQLNIINVNLGQGGYSDQFLMRASQSRPK